MSADGSNGGRPGREVAYRLFATEFDDATLSYAESDEERAPNYVISPTGARLNRVFVVGTLTEVTDVNEEMVRARVVDPTGAFVVYAGQYQPDALAFLERAEPPAFVAVTGKARTFEPEDGDRVYTSIRPESLAEVDGDTRDRWVIDAAERTLERIGTYAAAAELDVRGDELAEALLADGVREGLARGVPLAQDHYGTTPGYLAALREAALDAVRVVAGERSQVEPLEFTPGDADPNESDFASLAADGPSLSAPSRPATDDGGRTDEGVDGVDGTDAAAGAAVGTATTDGSTEAVGDDDGIGSDGATDEPTEADSASDEPAGADGASDEPAGAEAAVEESADEPADSGADEASTREGPDDGESTAADASAESDDELGDFESSGLDDELYELDEAEREQVEDEYGTEFTTGAEVDDPGEADVDGPDPAESGDPDGEEPAESDDAGATDDAPADDPGAEDQAEAQTEHEIADDESAGEDETADDESAGEDETAADEAAGEDEIDDDEAADEAEEVPADDVDLQALAVETMDELDEGDGADRAAVVDAVADRAGASTEAVEEAIQDALMGGECYEPADGTLKAI